MSEPLSFACLCWFLTLVEDASLVTGHREVPPIEGALSSSESPTAARRSLATAWCPGHSDDGMAVQALSHASHAHLVRLS